MDGQSGLFSFALRARHCILSKHSVPKQGESQIRKNNRGKHVHASGGTAGESQSDMLLFAPMTKRRRKANGWTADLDRCSRKWTRYRRCHQRKPPLSRTNARQRGIMDDARVCAHGQLTNRLQHAARVFHTRHPIHFTRSLVIYLDLATAHWMTFGASQTNQRGRAHVTSAALRGPK